MTVASRQRPSEAEIQRQIGALLRLARTRHGWSLHDVERHTSGEFKAVLVGSYERGDRTPTAPRLISLAAVYSVPITSLLPAGADDDVQGKAVLFEELADEFRDRAARLRGDEPVADRADDGPRYVTEGPGS